MALPLSVPDSPSSTDGSNGPQTPVSPSNSVQTLALPPPAEGAAPAQSTSPNNAAQPKRKPSRRANTAERRATHNAVERARRETLNGRFLVRPPILIVPQSRSPDLPLPLPRIWQRSSRTSPRSVVPPSPPSSTPPSPTSTPLAGTAFSLRASSASSSSSPTPSVANSTNGATAPASPASTNPSAARPSR